MRGGNGKLDNLTQGFRQIRPQNGFLRVPSLAGEAHRVEERWLELWNLEENAAEDQPGED